MPDIRETLKAMKEYEIDTVTIVLRPYEVAEFMNSGLSLEDSLENKGYTNIKGLKLSTDIDYAEETWFSITVSEN